MLKEIIENLSSENPWRDRIQFFETITSTNDVLKQLANQGAPEGTVLVADCQTGGRGRLGRTFLSPSQVGIYLSVLLRPNCKPSELMHLTCASATATCTAIQEAAGFRPGIKWTNDIVYENRKLSGTLTELSIQPDGSTAYAIIGTGINCNQMDFPPEIRDIAGSLKMATGRQINRALVAAKLIDALYDTNRRLLTGKSEIIASYRRDCVTLGRKISVIQKDRVRHGTALDVDEAGALIVRFDDGSVETVNSGEVSVRGMYNYV
ncbi:MAG: biotin--[acetyl-CoA-carboxylase] ligase [Firmicutes bacterium]|nr:biotin--[acetyl-CoA-carboxylase] ligase [Bacillota bacterium]MDY6161429.1 biotin--[acetyl-CoA-carboxylase] ligase [Candidatus Faecousia sp.]